MLTTCNSTTTRGEVGLNNMHQASSRSTARLEARQQAAGYVKGQLVACLQNILQQAGAQEQA